MTQDNEKSFEFELDKTVYFKPSYEISEMRKISLDPDILITPQDDYIQINGLILLQGEYEKSEQERSSEEVKEIEQSADLVSKITDLSDGLVKFSHHFPIDITVPAHRVRNLSNVSVVIQSFDYDLQRANALDISSKIEINGISTNVNEESQPVSAERIHKNGDNDHTELDDSDNAELTETNEKIEQPKQDERNIELKDSDSNLNQIQNDSDSDMSQERERAIVNVNSNERNEQNDEKETVQREENESKEEITIDREDSFSEKSEPHLINKTERLEKDEQAEISRSAEIVENETIETVDETERDISELDDSTEIDDVELDEDSEDVSDELEEREIDIQVKESEEETDDDVKDVHFLTTIFNRANEESYSQLRIYIVQDGDTVDSIAKRYEVSSLRLLQLNNLAGEDLVTGELLYIPEVSETKN